MEFPGLLGIALYRLRLQLRGAPIGALGPLLGIIGADMALDISRGRLGSVAIELVIAPMIAMSVSSVAQQEYSAWIHRFADGVGRAASTKKAS